MCSGWVLNKEAQQIPACLVCVSTPLSECSVKAHQEARQRGRGTVIARVQGANGILRSLWGGLPEVLRRPERHQSLWLIIGGATLSMSIIFSSNCLRVRNPDLGSASWSSPRVARESLDRSKWSTLTISFLILLVILPWPAERVPPSSENAAQGGRGEATYSLPWSFGGSSLCFFLLLLAPGAPSPESRHPLRSLAKALLGKPRSRKALRGLLRALRDGLCGLGRGTGGRASAVGGLDPSGCPEARGPAANKCLTPIDVSRR